MRDVLVAIVAEGHVLIEDHPGVGKTALVYAGPYPLPENQLDRFMIRASLGYPSADREVAMLSEHAAGDRVLELEPVAGVADVLAAQDAAMRVHTSDRLLRFVVTVLERIRSDARVAFGASPRSGLLLVRAAKALAALEGRDHVLPDDVQELVPAVLAHRLLLAPSAAGVERAEVLADALERIPAL